MRAISASFSFSFSFFFRRTDDGSLKKRLEKKKTTHNKNKAFCPSVYSGLVAIDSFNVLFLTNRKTKDFLFLLP
uniref:Uncharacterized protein n=1 Tax=Chlorella vulgaris TaxID=3077 RepID=V9H0S9_CHLVU|nr:hypothetical protein ChvulCp149 [Chlorella vulgaris]pir/T07335/ hypothetical protein 73b - Chlorella vulgaris chloroplast [Chlorella vulgaris]BAA57983.1 unnamed protein product [Chlorella vulgaris]